MLSLLHIFIIVFLVGEKEKKNEDKGMGANSTRMKPTSPPDPSVASANYTMKPRDTHLISPHHQILCEVIYFLCHIFSPCEQTR